MEFKEYIRIIKRHKILFWGIWLGIAAIVFFWAWSRPESFEAAMSVDIARQGAREDDIAVHEYDYDQYYRLEADDRFAGTMVQWLKDPDVVNSIYSEAELKAPGGSLRSLAGTFRAEKLASNYIQVRYSVANPADAGAIYRSAEKIITAKTEALNADARDQNWFKAIFSGPIVAEKKLPLSALAVGVLLGGLLVAIFGVLIKHYWEE